ncbi:MAG: DegT/DnrJ/EryC1/StrS family aminotransferase [Candidatus Cloacimonadaceae bacterium]
MKVPFLDLKAQYAALKSEIDEAIEEVIATCSFIGGEVYDRFRENFRQYIGAKHAVMVGNGTDALEIAIKSLELDAGSEIIVPANSFIASSEAVTTAGHKVVFCDIDDDTFNIDVSKIESLITAKTKAIMAVHLYGQPCDTRALKSICEKHDLFLIEDCAQAHGAQMSGKNVGTIGDIATFSFYPGKNLGAYGDGGAIVTDNDKLATFCQMYANHGRIEKYNHEFEGVNSRLDTLQCAVLDVKLRYLPEWNEKRRAVAERYYKAFRDLSWMRCQAQLEDTLGVFHLFAVRVKDRDSFINHLKDSNIQPGIHYPIGLPFLKAYEHLSAKAEDFPITHAHQNEIVSLPIFPEMSDEMVSYVIRTVQEFKHS